MYNKTFKQMLAYYYNPHLRLPNTVLTIKKMIIKLYNMGINECPFSLQITSQHLVRLKKKVWPLEASIHNHITSGDSTI